MHLRRLALGRNLMHTANAYTGFFHQKAFFSATRLRPSTVRDIDGEDRETSEVVSGTARNRAACMTNRSAGEAVGRCAIAPGAGEEAAAAARGDARR